MVYHARNYKDISYITCYYGEMSVRLRQINNVLSAIVVLLAVYILIWPFMPWIRWRVSHLPHQPSPSQLTGQVKDGRVLPKNVPTKNTVVIPRIDLTVQVNEGKDLSALNTGAWHRPQTSSPEKGGNTVIVGHRFTYSGQSYFYNLDKVQLKDPIVVYWDKKQYTYEVSEIKVVGADQISVEAPTKQTQLTLYTCTPLWNPKDRLVLVAKPIGEKQ